ncbi:G2/mitotic-specific cyclin [Mortierella sp. GBA30]|nr:G2/mitotic-specific cyclin [Mortierella sp. GBA30]
MSKVSRGTTISKSVNPTIQKLLCRTVPDPVQIERQRTAASAMRKLDATQTATATVSQGHPPVNTQERIEHCQRASRNTLVKIEDFNNQCDRKRTRRDSDESKDATRAGRGTASIKQPQSPQHPEKRQRTEGEPRRRPAQEVETAQEWEVHDPTLESEYSDDIFEYLREMEILLAPSMGYLERMSDEFWDRRQYFVNEIALVHARIRSHPETLFLAINIFDRVLSKDLRNLRRNHQNGVIALTCLLIASKYEERNPHANVYVFEHLLSIFNDIDPVVDFEIKAFRNCEQELLTMLDYKLGWPGPLSFLRRCSRADESEPVARTIAKYILEIVLLHHSFLVYKPSIQAAAAMYLGRCMMKRLDWNGTMNEYSGYTLQQIEPAVVDMLALLKESVVPQTAAYHKYLGRSTMRVSVYVHNWVHSHLPSSILHRRCDATTDDITTEANADMSSPSIV